MDTIRLEVEPYEVPLYLHVRREDTNQWWDGPGRKWAKDPGVPAETTGVEPAPFGLEVRTLEVDRVPPGVAVRVYAFAEPSGLNLLHRLDVTTSAPARRTILAGRG